MPKIYIDTNVLIDIVTGRQQPHVIYSQQLFANAVIGKVNMCTSALSFVTVMYVARRYGLSESDTKDSLKRILPYLDVVDLTAANVTEMLDTTWSDYEDATQHYSALIEDADYIATGNVRDFADSEIPAKTPHELLDILNDY